MRGGRYAIGVIVYGYRYIFGLGTPLVLMVNDFPFPLPTRDTSWVVRTMFLRLCVIIFSTCPLRHDFWGTDWGKSQSSGLVDTEVLLTRMQF